MNRALRYVLIAVTVILALTAIILFERHISIARLQTFKQKLMAQGELLTVDELVKKYPSDEHTNNSIGILSTAVPTIPMAPYSSTSFNLPEFVAPGRARVQWKGPPPAANPIYTNISVNGKFITQVLQSTNSWGGLHRQIAASEPGLAKIRAMLKHPDRDYGWDYKFTMTGGPNRGFVEKRSAAQIFSTATMDNLHERDLDAALQNLEAITDLTRLHDHDWELVTQMIKAAIAGLGLQTSWEAMQTDGWTEEQLSQLESAWQRVDLMNGLPPALEFQRAVSLQIFKELDGPNGRNIRKFISVSSSTPPNVKTPTAFLRNIISPYFNRASYNCDDEMFFLETSQVGIDLVRTLVQSKSWMRCKAKAAEYNENLNKLENANAPQHYYVSSVILPNYTRAFETVARNETLRQMLLADIALKRYHLRYGAYPAELKALVPQYLPTLPIDYMNGEPLHYRLNSDGTFTLYSVGADGNDNGGDSFAGVPKNKITDMWSGRDAVWPLAAAEIEVSADDKGERVAMQLKDVALKDALQLLSTQAGVRLLYDRESDLRVMKSPRGLHPVKIDCSNVTAQAVLITLLSNFNMEVTFTNGAARITSHDH